MPNTDYSVKNNIIDEAYIEATNHLQRELPTAPESTEPDTRVPVFGYRDVYPLNNNYPTYTFAPPVYGLQEPPLNYEQSESEYRQQATGNLLNKYQNHLQELVGGLRKLSNLSPQQKFNALLFDFINTKDSDKLQELLTENDSCFHPFDINELDDLGRTALMIAVIYKDNKIIKMLIDNKNINVDKTDREGHTAVMIAIEEGSYEITKKLIKDSTANLYIKNNVDCTTLELAMLRIKDNGEILDLVVNNMDLKNEYWQNKLVTSLTHIMSWNITDNQAKVLINKFPSYLHRQNKDGDTAFSVTLKKRYYERAELIIKNTPSDKQDELRLQLLTQVIDLETNPEIIKKYLTNNKNTLNKQNQDGKTALMNMILEDNVDIVKKLVHGGADVNLQDKQGYTALMFAISKGNHDIVKLLLKNGVDLNTQNSFELTALMFAIYTNKNEIAETLINSGRCDLNKLNKAGETALMIAVFTNNIKITQSIIKKLTDEGSSLNTQDYRGRTALMIAVINGNPDILELFLINKADKNAQNGYTALMYAIKYQKNEIAVSLINSGRGDLNKQNTAGHTALMMAAYANNVEIVQQLIQAGADLNRLNKLGNPALIFATTYGRYNTAKLLVENGADLNIQHNIGYTPLTDAICRGHHDIVKLLVKNGVDLNTANNKDHDYTPLMFAINNDNNEIAEILINSGRCAVNKQSKSGATALMLAIIKGNVEIAKKLIKQIKTDGGDLNLQDKNGNNALIYATDKKLHDIVELLVEYGANVKQKNKHGMNPIKLAKSKGSSDITKILKSRQSSLSCMKIC